MKGLILSFFNNYERRKNMDFSALEKSIGYTFKDKNLLKNLKKIKNHRHKILSQFSLHSLQGA